MAPAAHVSVEHRTVPRPQRAVLGVQTTALMAGAAWNQECTKNVSFKSMLPVSFYFFFFFNKATRRFYITNFSQPARSEGLAVSLAPRPRAVSPD